VYRYVQIFSIALLLINSLILLNITCLLFRSRLCLKNRTILWKVAYFLSHYQEYVGYHRLNFTQLAYVEHV